MLIRHQIVGRTLDQEKDHADLLAVKLLLKLSSLDRRHGRRTFVFFLYVGYLFGDRSPDDLAHPPVTRIVEQQHIAYPVREQSVDTGKDRIDLVSSKRKSRDFLEAKLTLLVTLNIADLTPVHRNDRNRRIGYCQPLLPKSPHDRQWKPKRVEHDRSPAI